MRAFKSLQQIHSELCQTLVTDRQHVCGSIRTEHPAAEERLHVAPANTFTDSCHHFQPLYVYLYISLGRSHKLEQSPARLHWAAGRGARTWPLVLCSVDDDVRLCAAVDKCEQQRCSLSLSLCCKTSFQSQR